jgi:hypothetical protein
MAFGYAAGSLVDRNEPHVSRVLYGLPVQRDLMLRSNRFRGIVDRLHLFRRVIEAVEVVGRAGAAAPPALRERSHTRGGDEEEKNTQSALK